MSGRGGPPAGGFSAAYRVRFDEGGPDGVARASVLLRQAHDVAWRHSGHLGFDRDWYAARKVGWLVRTVDLDVRRPIAAGTDVQTTTEVVAHGRIWARRRSEATLVGRSGPDEAAPDPAAVSLTDWVLIDERGRPARIPSDITALFGPDTEHAEPARVQIGEPPPAAVRLPLAIRRHELDPNGHVNNAVHLDWIDEVVRQTPADGAAGPDAADRFPRRYRVEYLAPVALDDRVELAAWPETDGWSIQLARPMDGRVMARARLILRPARPAAG
jgi:acyl-CoA thioesterase FadM